MTSLPPPGEHGGDVAAIAAALDVGLDDLIDLSISMNPFAPDVAAIAAQHLGVIAGYPNPEPGERLLADTIGVDPDRLVLTNGGAEAIALVAQLQPDGWVNDPDFSLYRRHLRNVAPEHPRWRSNPSNPLGRLADLSDTCELGAPGHPAVWDEAFYPLATGSWTAPELADHGVWRLGSLTKLWACPGLRLGYAIAPDAHHARSLRAIRPRWSVGSLALAVLPELLDRTDLVDWSRRIAAARTDFAQQLTGLGVNVEVTDVNWLLVRTDGLDLRTALAHEGVIVRDMTSFGLSDMVRVAVPHAADEPRVIDAFRSVVGQR